MSDQIINQPDLRLTRSQIQKFVGDDPQSARTLERQIQYVNELYRKPAISVVRQSNLSISPTSTPIAIEFDKLIYSNQVTWSITAPSVIVIGKSGRYRLSIQVNALNETSTNRIYADFWFRVNGVDYDYGASSSFAAANSFTPPTLDAKSISFTAPIVELVSQDEIQLFVQADNGGLVLSRGAFGGGPNFASCSALLERVY